MMRSRRQQDWAHRSHLLILAVAVILAISACTTDGDDEPETTTTTGDNPATTSGDGGGDTTTTVASGESQYGGTLTIAIASDPTQLDPWNWGGRVNRVRLVQMYNGLVEYNLEDYSVDPALAESWEVSDDGLTYTFNLVDGVTFHNGSEFTSADAAYSVEKARSEESGSTSSLVALVDSVDAPDDLTLVLNLAAPDRNLLDSLTNVFMVPDDETIDHNATPIGTGPFVLTEFNPNQDMVFERNENYFKEGLPYLDRLITKTVPDANSQALQLINGDVDMIAPQASFAQVEQLQDAGMVLPSLPGDQAVGYFDLRLNTRVEPWSDPRVRQALAYSIDREAIVEALLGQGYPIADMFDPGSTFYSPDTPDYAQRDVERARELLEEAGYPDGVTSPVFVCANVGDEYVITSQVVQESVADAGISLELENMDVGTWVERVQQEMNFDAGLCGFLPPPGAYNAVEYTWGRADGVAMGWEEQNPEFYELLGEVRSMQDDDAYVAAIEELHLEGMQGSPRIIAAGQKRAPALQEHVRGFTPDLQLLTFVEEVWLDQ